jgi:flagellar basal body-associated protein FliL
MMNAYRASKIALVVALVVLMIYTIYGAFFKDGPQFGLAINGSPKKESTNPLETNLNQILINLPQGEFGYLKAEIAVTSSSKEGKKNVEAYQEGLRRLVLQIASREDGDALATPEGKAQFKARIKEAARQEMGIELEDVYFRNFVLAR